MSNSNGIISSPVSAKDVYAVLGIRPRTNGYDVGYACSNLHNKINPYSVYKPYISNSIVSSESWRQSANYGWTTNNKTTSETTLTYLNKLKANGENAMYWNYNVPAITSSEPGRLLDFNRYNHFAKPYGQPLTVKRVNTSVIQENVDNKITLTKNTNTTGSVKTSNFSYYGGVDVKATVSLASPSYSTTSSYTWDCAGIIYINIVTSDGKTLASDNWSLNDWSKEHTITLSGFDGRTGTAYLEYSYNFDNYSYVYGNNEEYFDITLNIHTEYALTYTISTTGNEGLYLYPNIYASEWWYSDETTNPEDSVFKNYSEIDIIELTNGNTTERRMCHKLHSGTTLFFNLMGFSENMINTWTNAYVYFLYGDADSIFGYTGDSSSPYGDISLADTYELIPFPHPYMDVSEVIIYYQMDIYSGDFQYIEYTYSDGTVKRCTNLGENGFNNTAYDADVDSFEICQAIVFEHVSAATTATFCVELYNDIEDEPTIYTESASLKASDTDSQYVQFTLSCVTPESYRPWDWAILVYVLVNGEKYYLDMYKQSYLNKDVDDLSEYYYTLGLN